MKYAYFALIFVAGIVIGRWSVPAFNPRALSTPTLKNQKTGIDGELLSNVAMTSQTDNQPPIFLPGEAATIKQKNPSPLIRTADKAKDKEIRELYSRFLSANQRNNIEEQNSVFVEMEALDPRNENVFQAKARFLEDDDNWDAAYDTYKECISAVPTSVPCLRRLANIRTSTLDEKLKYGLDCLHIAPKDSMCLVDVAIALSGRGEYSRAKEFYERALRLPRTGLGYDREYVLFHYGMTLRNLSLPVEARKAFMESCRLRMKSACDELK